jgi:hypothetical protein
MKQYLALFTVVLFFQNFSHAYFTTGESGEIPKSGVYRIGLEPQFILSGTTGTNFGAFIDVPVGEAASIRGRLGFGVTDFFTSFSYKWIPIPDYGKQPAMGGKAEFIYARIGVNSATAIRIHPLISKKFEVNYGNITTYGALPLSITNTQTGTDTAMQLAGGIEISPKQIANWSFGTEIGFSLNKSFNYLSGSATYYLQDKRK